MFRPLPGREFFLVFHKDRFSDFLIYINDLPNGIQSICKIIADNTSLFSKYHNFKKSEYDLNEDLTITKKWTFQCKMDFNLDPKKQAIDVCFSRKIVSSNPSPLSFNNLSYPQALNQHSTRVAEKNLLTTLPS